VVAVVTPCRATRTQIRIRKATASSSYFRCLPSRRSFGAGTEPWISATSVQRSEQNVSTVADAADCDAGALRNRPPLPPTNNQTLHRKPLLNNASPLTLLPDYCYPRKTDGLAESARSEGPTQTQAMTHTLFVRLSASQSGCQPVERHRRAELRAQRHGRESRSFNRQLNDDKGTSHLRSRRRGGRSVCVRRIHSCHGL
jgi:hypothetical protein